MNDIIMHTLQFSWRRINGEIRTKPDVACGGLGLRARLRTGLPFFSWAWSFKDFALTFYYSAVCHSPLASDSYWFLSTNRATLKLPRSFHTSVSSPFFLFWFVSMTKP